MLLSWVKLILVSASVNGSLYKYEEFSVLLQAFS